MTQQPGGGPEREARRRELLREYRHFVRVNHPDRGGDPEEFAAGLRRYRKLLEEGSPPPPVGDVVAHRRATLPAQLLRMLVDRRRRGTRPRVE